jgi:hypothetical protein
VKEHAASVRRAEVRTSVVPEHPLRQRSGMTPEPDSRLVDALSEAAEITIAELKKPSRVFLLLRAIGSGRGWNSMRLSIGASGRPKPSRSTPSHGYYGDHCSMTSTRCASYFVETIGLTTKRFSGTT